MGLYELTINGSRAGDAFFAPGWTNYKKRLQYQTYDVTGMLHSGENAIGVMLGKGWYSGDIGLNKARDSERALLLQLCVRYITGKTDTIVTDTGWKTCAGPVLMSEIYHGETFDARLIKKGWDMPGYDDSLWRNAKKHGYYCGTLVAQENEPVRMTDVISPVGVITTPKGESVLDFGQNMVGRVRFRTKGSAGRAITLTHAEVLDNEGNFYTENLRKAKQSVTYIFSGNEVETYRPHFTFQGFRYVKVDNYQGDLQPDDFKGEVLHSDLEVTGSFRCSSELVNRLQSNILWSQKGNFLDVPTDCPQRDERLGWTGDAQMFISTACFNMNVAAFFRKWLRDLYSEQSPDKGVPEIIPDVLRGKGASSSAWGDAATICPWAIYRCYGDRDLLEEQYESMKMWVEYIRGEGDSEFLWNTGFHFGDWLGLDSKPDSYVGATPSDFIASAFYAYSTDILARTAKVLGKTDDEDEYSKLHAGILRSFRDEFVSGNGRLVSPTQTPMCLLSSSGLSRKSIKKESRTLL